jgi:glycosyltransferase involved in cell wall biosynthesis
MPGISTRKVNPIPNAIPCGEYYQPESRISMREELGLNPSNIAIGFTGRLEKVKNLDLLLTAFRNIHLHWPETRLVIAGEGDLMDALQKQSADLGLMNDVFWMGFFKDIPRLLSAMDIYIQPSINEGLSLSILEAMAAELPVISTKVDSATEIITDGVNGMLIPPSSTRHMEESLRVFLEDPARRAKLASEGRKTVLTNYDLPIMVDHYSQLYENLIIGR